MVDEEKELNEQELEVKEENEELEQQDSDSSELTNEDLSETDEQFSELEAELAKEKEEKEKYIDRLQRLQAEFSNYRKRVTKEKEMLATQAKKDFILELLPVIDNFERALESSETSEDTASLLEGVEMIYRQIKNLLTKNGVEEIVTVGEEFDPNFHNAVMKEASEEYESGIIIEELQKGYSFNNIAIRPAMVKVAE
ncbi:nucleotide exchange factor GrpE [Orenia marismortui]|uniref:Protein GrpE n=1 Tax=Orenia marismortui TaxID=46469 RepID=A0A4R8GY01_9FIRM|nr:nucleotide exchange factor GrpE [Orenia marismortui]TDX51075.1 molecular chaperone GrpE [Orenia marismortui]